MSERTTGRMPRRYTQGIFKNKQEIEKYKKIADKVLKQSKTYEKESKLVIIGLIISVIILAVTPLVILFKNKYKKNIIKKEIKDNAVSINEIQSKKYNDIF